MSLHEARFIISFYDSNFDGNLNYTEFLNILISEHNYTLRRIALDRLGSSYNNFRRVVLPFDVEYAMTKLLERELELVRNLEFLLNDIRARYDFNVLDLFSSMQVYSYLTGEK